MQHLLFIRKAHVIFIIIKRVNDFMICMIPNANHLIRQVVVYIVKFGAQVRLSVVGE